MQDLFIIKKILASKGIAYRFESQINSYSDSLGILRLSYQGSNDKIIQTLNTLDNEELEPGRVLKMDSLGNPYHFIIQENEKVEVNETSS